MGTKSSTPVAVIILNWNGIKDTRECLNFFKRVVYREFNLIVMDNGSDTNEAEILYKEYHRFFPNFECVRLEKNHGFAEGCNIGIRYAQRKFDPKYFLLINNDTLVRLSFLNELVSATEADDSVGMASPKILCYPERNKIWWKPPYKFSMRWKVHKTLKLAKKTSEIDVITGCCVLIKSEVIQQIGYLDPRFFLSGADTIEYSLRAKSRGFKLFYVPSAKIWHKAGQAALKFNPIQRLKREVQGEVLCYSLCAKPYHLPSLMVLYFFKFLREKLEYLISNLTNKEKREKFQKRIINF